VSQRQRHWNEVDGEKHGVDSRDEVRHINRNDQFVGRMMLVAEQE